MTAIAQPKLSLPPNESGPPFRFYDNRQKMSRIRHHLQRKSHDQPPRCAGAETSAPVSTGAADLDAGMGDATLLARVMRSAHRFHPTVPNLIVAKEISLKDVRLGLEKMPDRFCEHAATVVVITNLNCADAPRLTLKDSQAMTALNWQEVSLIGGCAQEYAEQIEELSPMFAHGWQTKPSAISGNPVYVRPTVLVIYRQDYAFMLDGIIPLRTRGAANPISGSSRAECCRPGRLRSVCTLAVFSTNHAVRPVISPLAHRRSAHVQSILRLTSTTTRIRMARLGRVDW